MNDDMLPNEDPKAYHRRRRNTALSLRRKNMTFQAIGDILGVTRERVRQMCNQAYAEENASRG